MSDSDPRVTQWDFPEPPDQGTLEAFFTKENLSFYRWSNGSNDVYSSHRHTYHKVIYVVRGEINFGLPEKDISVHLKAGDRLDLPAGVLHNAVVGPSGVVCLEAHRKDDFS